MFWQRQKTPPRESLAPPSQRDTFVFSRYSLLTEDVEVQLAEGETTLGRSLECSVVVDSPMVSRRHAVLLIAGSRVVLRDADSSNGVIVNGQRIHREARLRPGDSFAIGDSVFELIASSGTARGRTSTEPPPRITKPGRPSVPPTQATQRGSALELLGVIAEKALALHRHEEAVRLLGGHIQAVHRGVVQGEAVDGHVVQLAVTFSIHIAASANDSSWAELAFEMLSQCKVVPSADTVDLLYPMAAELLLCYPLLKRYCQLMKQQRDHLSPPDQFALKRLEGLERLVALKMP